MPGLFGIYSKTNRLGADDLRGLAARMAAAMQRLPWLQAEMAGDDRYYGGRVHIGVLNPQPQPLIGERLSRMWFDGEVYPEQQQGIAPAAGEIESWTDESRNRLAEIDGIFSFACYDAAAHALYLGNDRFGFRPLYSVETDQWFAYAAEVKALLAILDRRPSLDEVALRQFFSFGHMFGERTWWRGIELLPPASLWKVTARGRSERRYWSFDDIRQDFRPVDEVLGEFGRLWRTAVRQRLRPGPVRILLSGGLDSRLLLAELRRQGAEVTALTFGEEDCPDIRIARECARIAGVPHLVRHITGENWWEGREDAVWQTDGLMNAVHFHEAIIRNDLHAGNWITQKSNVADAILHGKHIDEKPADDWAARPEKVLRRRMLKSPFFNADEVLACSAEDARRYLGGPTVEGFYFLQNTRRLNLGGNLLLAPYCEVLLPRASYPLLRLVLSALPPSERAGGKFYLRFLIENYPEYFGNTPWQSSGRGIHESDPVRWARDLRDGGKRYLFNLAPRVPGVWRVASRLRPHYQYFADYPELIRHSGVREKLLSQELLCDEFLDGRSRRVLADPPERAEERAQTILAILSFETYLRQVQGLPGVRGAQSA